MADKNSKKPKGLIEQINEINRQDRIAEMEAEHAEMEARERARKKAKDAYAEKLRRERVELMRQKQGIAPEETEPEEEKVEKVYTLREKISNFFYVNKLYIIVGTIAAAFVIFFAVDLLTRVNPDGGLLILTPDYSLSTKTDIFSDLLSEYTEDVNGDKKQIFDVVFLPLSKNGVRDQQTQGYTLRFAAELQLTDNMLIIADDELAKEIELDSGVLDDLRPLFPDNPNVKENGFYLKGTGLAEYLGLDEDIDDNVFIGIRKVNDYVGKDGEMQQRYDESLSVLTQFIEKFSQGVSADEIKQGQ